MSITKSILQSFCCEQSDERPELVAPFSIGDYSYATNGHVMIRVPRMKSVPERSTAPRHAEKIMADARKWAEIYFEVQPVDNPGKVIDCPICKGRKTYYREICPECGGSGEEKIPIPVKIGEASFSGFYVNKIAALPKCRLSATRKDKVAHFLFTGGEGVLMPMRA